MPPEEIQDKAKEPEANEPIKVDIFGIKFDIPKSIFQDMFRELFYGKGLLIIVAALSIYNFHLTNNQKKIGSEATLRPSASSSEAIDFSKTFIFWTPEFKPSNLRPEFAKSAQDTFHKKLKEIFGGWTRWEVHGSDDISSEPGWFYQTSLPQDKKQTTDDIERLLRRIFNQSDYYIVSIDHKK